MTKAIGVCLSVSGLSCGLFERQCLASNQAEVDEKLPGSLCAEFEINSQVDPWEGGDLTIARRPNVITFPAVFAELMPESTKKITIDDSHFMEISTMFKTDITLNNPTIRLGAGRGSNVDVNCDTENQCVLETWMVGGSLKVTITPPATLRLVGTVDANVNVEFDGPLQSWRSHQYQLDMFKNMPLPTDGYFLEDGSAEQGAEGDLTARQAAVVRWVATLPEPRPKIWIPWVVGDEGGDFLVNVDEWIAEHPES
jgi:hypothetical protein